MVVVVRILILTFGTRGDVQPYLALARGLLTAGHEAAVCTAAGYRELVAGAGVPYVQMANDMLELVQAGMPAMAGPVDAVRLVRRMTAAMRTSLLDQWEAAQAFEPDLIVYHPKTLGGLHIAERLGVPAALSLPLPFFTPTRAYPIPFIAHWPLHGNANRWSYQFNRFTALAYGGMINTFRHRTLGLAPLSRASDYLDYTDGRPVPVLYAYSPTVVPIPPDYPPHVHVTGYWHLPVNDSWQPPTDLDDFLAAGDPPVYVGFGSMGFGRHAVDRGEIIVDAARRAGLRVVVASGWGGIKIATSTADVHVVDDISHDWLFPQTAAVVHHGGAGTTAAGLRAGRPTLVCPVLGDQGFWAERLRTLQVGPPPLPVRRLTTDQLAPRLHDLVTTTRYLTEATAVAAKLRDEDGVTTAVHVLEQISSTHRH